MNYTLLFSNRAVKSFQQIAPQYLKTFWIPLKRSRGRLTRKDT